MNIPLERCRNLRPMAFPCKVGVGNPFVDTAVAYIHDDCLTYDDSPLFEYYRDWRPSTAAELVGVSGNRKLADFSPLAYVVPWLQDDPERNPNRRAEDIENENRQHGVELSISEGHKGWGPVSREKGDLEFERLISTYHSMKEIGYVPDMGYHITGEVLVRDRDWRVFVGSGQHRVAVLAAMEYEAVRIYFRNKHRKARDWPDIIRREDVHQWPHVRSGLYTPDEALTVFDRVFEGRQPPACVEATGGNAN